MSVAGLQAGGGVAALVAKVLSPNLKLATNAILAANRMILGDYSVPTPSQAPPALRKGVAKEGLQSSEVAAHSLRI